MRDLPHAYVKITHPLRDWFTARGKKMLPALRLVLGPAASESLALAGNRLFSSDLELFYLVTARIFGREIYTK